MRALEQLNYLGALDDDGNLTPMGSTMYASPDRSRGEHAVLLCAQLTHPFTFPMQV